jgi:lipoprotein signal peptidase
VRLKKRNKTLSKVNYHKLLFLSYFILPLVFADQAVKLIVGKYFYFACNRFGVLGLTTGGLPVFIGVLLLVAYSIYIEKRRYALIGLSLIFAGGFSNIIDRLFLGCVRDFVSISAFPIFNSADAFITIGVMVLIFGLTINRND